MSSALFIGNKCVRLRTFYLILISFFICTFSTFSFSFSTVVWYLDIFCVITKWVPPQLKQGCCPSLYIFLNSYGLIQKGHLDPASQTHQLYLQLYVLILSRRSNRNLRPDYLRFSCMLLSLLCTISKFIPAVPPMHQYFFVLSSFWHTLPHLISLSGPTWKVSHEMLAPMHLPQFFEAV